MYNNAPSPELQLCKKQHSISYHMAWKAVASGVCRIAKEDRLTNLADLFTKLFPRTRREYILNKFTYWELDKIIISGSKHGRPGYYIIKLAIIEYAIISDRGDRVNPVRIESCDFLWTSAEALMSKCVVIIDDPSDGGIIKCEWLNSERFEV